MKPFIVGTLRAVVGENLTDEERTRAEIYGQATMTDLVLMLIGYERTLSEPARRAQLDAEARAAQAEEAAETLRLKLEKAGPAPFKHPSQKAICESIVRVAMDAAEAAAVERDEARAALRAALDESGCDGDLCAHRWHDLARIALAHTDFSPRCTCGRDDSDTSYRHAAGCAALRS